MTNDELKEIISGATQPEWFKNISVVFDFPAEQRLPLKGLSAIYEFVNLQISGWNSYENLPDQLSQCKTHFGNIQDAIMRFVSDYSQSNEHSLNTNWQRQVKNRIDAIANNRVLQYNAPQVDFLLTVHQNTPDYFPGAYNFVLGLNYSIGNREVLYGAILAQTGNFTGYNNRVFLALEVRPRLPNFRHH